MRQVVFFYISDIWLELHCRNAQNQTFTTLFAIGLGGFAAGSTITAYIVDMMGFFKQIKMLTADP